MGRETTYTCDQSGDPCNDSDIAADDTDATMRVELDATIYYRDEGGHVRSFSTGPHVFSSVDHMVAWAQALGF